MSNWDSIYEEKGVFQIEISERAKKAVAFFLEKGLTTILDLGCGTGRHTRYLVENGFNVYSCDSSSEAVTIAKDNIPGAQFDTCEMISLPYNDVFFDAVLCNHVIQHGMLSDIEKTISDIYRVLREGGYLFLITVSTNHHKALTGREIEPNTRINTDAFDGHIPHHFFSELEIKQLFAHFEILHLEHFEGPSELDPSTWSAAWELYAIKK